jgi:hypothetical protein
MSRTLVLVDEACPRKVARECASGQANADERSSSPKAIGIGRVDWDRKKKANADSSDEAQYSTQVDIHYQKRPLSGAEYSVG